MRTSIMAAGSRLVSLTAATLVVSACTSLPRSSVKASTFASQAVADGVSLVSIRDATSLAVGPPQRLGEDLASRRPADMSLQAGDKLEITLFEGGGTDLATSLQSGVAKVTSVIQRDGSLTVPFAGSVIASDLSTAEIEEAIAERLRGKLVDAQVVVSVAEQSRGHVTLVGANVSSLDSRRARLLDALAAFDVPPEDVPSYSAVLSRDGLATTISMRDALALPTNNIVLLAGDTVHLERTVDYATVVGATRAPSRVDVSNGDVSILDLLADSGGLDDRMADPSLVFLVRPSEGSVEGRAGRPIVIVVDMTSAADLALAAEFKVADSDTLYVPTAGYVDVQTVLGSISGTASLAGPALR